jgi:hypothetical protein
VGSAVFPRVANEASTVYSKVANVASRVYRVVSRVDFKCRQPPGQNTQSGVKLFWFAYAFVIIDNSQPKAVLPSGPNVEEFQKIIGCGQSLCILERLFPKILMERKFRMHTLLEAV